MLADQISTLYVFLDGRFWIFKVFVIVLATLLVKFFVRAFLRRLGKQFAKTRNFWDDAILAAVHKPCSVLIWVLGLSFAAQIVVVETGAQLFEFGQAARVVGVIVAVTWFFNNLARNVEAQYIQKNRNRNREEAVDRATIEALGKLLRATVVTTAVIVILQTLGFSISGVLAFGGIGGIAIGFAAKDLLSNVFGGLMIYLDRPFSVGDWIRSPDRAIEGTVEYIGWRITRIRTFELRPLYVPNSVFADIVVENPSRMQYRRIYETIGVRYNDINHMKAIVTDVRAMLMEHPEINEQQTLIVNFDAFSASSVDFFVYAFTHTTRWTEFHRIKQNILLAIAEIIARHDAEIAYPTSTLYIKSPTSASDLQPQ